MIAALLAEGSSDKVLLPILRWVLWNATPRETRIEWIDVGSFRRPLGTLAEKVLAARLVGAFDLLFIHRDADGSEPEVRYDEIRQAAGGRPHVGVVPVRMTEAWLLMDESAIRQASGRVSGTADLALPAISKVESDPDPKETLHAALRRANGSTGRRATRFHVHSAVHRVAHLVEDWAPLRRLAAFRRLEQDTRNALIGLNIPVRTGAD